MKITTKEELLAHIEAHKGQDVPLFCAIGNHGAFVMDETLKAHHKIEIRNTRKSNQPFIHLDGTAMFSLKDRHLADEQNYNDNWWFTTREEAEAYVKR